MADYPIPGFQHPDAVPVSGSIPIWNGQQYKPKAPGSFQQFARIDLYVSDVNGSDDNDGLASSSPLKTLAAATGKLSHVLDYPVVIHLGKHGGDGYSWPTVGPLLNRSRVWIIGDGAGQDGEDGFTELKASSAATAGTNRNKVVSTSLSANAFLGKTIEILDGAAAGDRRTIRDNTTTDINVCVKFTSPGPSSGDSFRIVEPEVDITDTDDKVMVTSMGASEGPPGGILQTGRFLALVNLSNKDTFGVTAFDGTHVVLCGFEIAGIIPFIQAGNGWLGLGVSDAVLGAFRVFASEDFDGVSDTAWFGWGMTCLAGTDANLSQTRMAGTMVAPGLDIVDGTQFSVLGGNFHTNGVAVDGISTYAFASLTSGSLAANQLDILVNNDSGDGLTFTNMAFGFLSSFVVTGSRTGLRVDNGSWCRASTGSKFDGTSDFGALAYRGGRILYSSSGALSNTVGGTADLSVDNSAGVADTALGSADATHPATTARPDNSVIQRIF